MSFWFHHRYEFRLHRYHDRRFVSSIASSSTSSLDTIHLSLICSVWLHGLLVSFFARCVCSSHRHWKDLISLSLFSLPPSPPSFFIVFFSLSSLCRGGALSDGWSAQTDPDPAWGDGEHVVMLVVLLKSALLKPWAGNQTDCGPVGLESQYIFWYLIPGSTRSLLE